MKLLNLTFFIVLIGLNACHLNKTNHKIKNNRQDNSQPKIVRGFMMSMDVKDSDFKSAVKWGANVVRIQLRPGSFAIGQGKEFWEAWPLFLKEMERDVKMIKEAGLKVVVCMLFPPYNDVKIDQPELWNKKDLDERFCRVWSDIAKCLNPYKDVIWGYDLYNEPLDRTQLPSPPKQWRSLAEKIIQAIREVDKDTWIIYEPGPGGLCTGFKDLQPLPDNRIIYSPHFYFPHAFTHQGVINIAESDVSEIMKKINIEYPSEIDSVYWDKEYLNSLLKDVDEFQTKWNVPVYVGEFSVVRWAPTESALRWLKDVTDLFESRGWSWTYCVFRGWNGWSLEHDNQFWKYGMPLPEAVNYETKRAALIKELLKKNSDE